MTDPIAEFLVAATVPQNAAHTSGTLDHANELLVQHPQVAGANLYTAAVLGDNALVLGTPENFGYMSGMMKDFLERIFYECEGKIEGRPWALLVSAGQDGAGAIASVERIVTGLRLKKVREPILALKEVTPEILAECEELGAALAAGLALGIY